MILWKILTIRVDSLDTLALDSITYIVWYKNYDSKYHKVNKAINNKQNFSNLKTTNFDSIWEAGGKTAFYSVMTKHVVWLSVKSFLWFHQQIYIKKMEGNKYYWTIKMALKAVP